jgi:hypothetical protein
MKIVKIRVQSSKHLPYKVGLPPGTTVSDIRRYLQLDDDYVLGFVSTPHRTFEGGDDVYALVTNGAELIAMTSVQAADAFMEHLAFGEGDI